jgi:hydrogenase maturation protein HypF
LLRSDAPPQARIDAVEVEELPAGECSTVGAGFEIRLAAGDALPRPTIPADLATCDACRQEIRDARQRRAGYPFTNCTNCGPRWSIIRQLPYDRPRTSMSRFPMCPACQAEYDDPADRRFHAQPIACPQCGPQLRLLDAGGQVRAEREGALQAAVDTLCRGQVVALQGLGGFQLLVDATDVDAVSRLRRRKHRPDRPFALMFPSLDAVRQCCLVSEAEARELLSPAAPILLLQRAEASNVSGTLRVPLGDGTRSVPDTLHATADTNPKRQRGADSAASLALRVGMERANPSLGQNGIAANVAPGNPYLGVMLPYTPLHHLLMEAVARPLVCTSGNLSEEPMAIEIDDALRRLGGLGRKAKEPIADLLLVHDRPIVRPVDDSVARIGPDGLQVLRRARGFAPLPIKLDFATTTVLAVGGHLKSTVALAVGGQGPASVVLSQHIGDLESSLSLNVFRRAIDDLLEFFAVKPQAVACDLHPDYASTRHAGELARRFKVPLVQVQHHHAHVAACMAEHGLEGPVLGLAWDGTGFGTDRTIWGGEALVCRGPDCRRVAHLRTFPLLGGDRAARQPRRVATGLLYEIMGAEAFTGKQAEDLSRVAGGQWFSEPELRIFSAMLARRLNCPRSSSMGRLFDAVAALCRLGQEMTFEGQAAMKLEFAAEPEVMESYSIPLRVSADGLAADWEPMFRQILDERLRGEPVGRISARFHNGLAQLAVDLARKAECGQIVLTGGCFQNMLLTQRVRTRLLESGFTVFTHQRVPPGDGGIALGQIFVAARQMRGPIDVPGNTR